MRGWRVAVALAVMAAAGPVGSGQARPLAAGGANGQDVVEVLRAAGMAPEMKTDGDGDPVVYGRHGGTRFGVFFYECRGGRCGSIQFSAAFSTAQGEAKAAEWNRARRFARAYVARDGTLYAEMDVELSQGGSTEGIAANLARWRAVLTEFSSFAR